MLENNDLQIATSIDPKLLPVIDKAAEREGISRAAFVRRAILRDLRKVVAGGRE